MRIQQIKQGTSEWMDMRSGVITGTRLAKVMKANNSDLMYELIAESMAPKAIIPTNDAMERGTFLEPDAVAEFEKRTGNLVESVGFVLHDKYDWLGFSPDGLIGLSEYTDGLEIKCPDSKNHIAYLAKAKIPAVYKWQVVHGFIVCDTVERWHFATYDPRISLEKLKMGIVTVTREEMQEDIDVAMEALLKFRKKWEKLQEQLIF